MSTETPTLLKVEQAARVLQVGRSKAYAMVADGSLPSVRVGKSVRVPFATLQRWIDQSTRGGEPDQAA